ncbi:MAG: cyclic nucleotide-binding domain-containing protein [Myxococcales bacterium]|nr:cyclic nucleotide-binding domain-containing protein [Myxococcales bacterium]MCB9642517.1 cyclic nucleotide-binding domain-containing protein [Myxococcales bacterium]
MSLQDAILRLARQPGSVKARLLLAHELHALGYQTWAEEISCAAVEAAASRGEFFSALALCRLHVPEHLHEEMMACLASRFAVERRVRGEPPPPPQPAPHIVALPLEVEAQVKFARKIGTDLTGVGHPEGTPMPYVPLFGDLTSDEFIQMGMSLVPQQIPEGEILLRQGEKEQQFYLLSHGVVEVQHIRPNGQSIPLALVESPTYVGEMGLLTTVSHRASVIARSHVIAWSISAEQLAVLGRRHPEILKQIRHIVRQRQLENLMRLSPVFSAVSVKERLLRSFRLRVVEVDEQVFSQNQPPPGLFVIMHGEAVVLMHTPDGRRVHLATLGEGDTFGEFSLLNNEPTNAGVWMPDGGIVLHLPVEAYRQLRQDEPTLESTLRELMVLRSQELRDIINPIPISYETLDPSWLLPQGPSETWEMSADDLVEGQEA